MAGFVYFLEGAQSITLTEMGRAGLGDIVSRGPQFTRVDRGPVDVAGLLIAHVLLPEHERAGAERPHVRYEPKAQVWQKRSQWKPTGDGGEMHVWLGYERERRPRPIDLVRERALAGYVVRLEDDADWVVPAARHLPAVLAADEAGDILDPTPPTLDDPEFSDAIRRYAVPPRFVPYCAAMAQAWEYMQGRTEGRDELSWAEQFRLGVLALSQNYRVGVPELSVLRIVTTDNLAQILGAMLDLPMYEAVLEAQATAEKKTDCASISDG